MASLHLHLQHIGENSKILCRQQDRIGIQYNNRNMLLNTNIYNFRSNGYMIRHNYCKYILHTRRDCSNRRLWLHLEYTLPRHQLYKLQQNYTP